MLCQTRRKVNTNACSGIIDNYQVYNKHGKSPLIPSRTAGADWPVGLPGDRPVGPPKIIITFLNFAIKWQLVLFGRGPLLLP